MLPHFIKHYRKNFPDCRIVVYDNESTDLTAKIAEEAGCEVISYHTGNKLSDSKYLDIKNNCWKGCGDWVIIADCDEFVDVTDYYIGRETVNGNTVLHVNGYNMVNLYDNMAIGSIKNAVRATSYDKLYCFDARKITDINYGPGAHSASPQGRVKYSEMHYRCRHYKYLNPDYMVKRHAMFAKRLSDENKKAGWGTHYEYTEKQIREEFNQARLKAITIL